MATPLVPDELWAVIEPLLPSEPPKPKGFRPRLSDRECPAGIILVLRSSLALQPPSGLHPSTWFIPTRERLWIQCLG